MSEYVKIKRKLYDELVETKAKYEVIKQLLETVNKVYEEQLKEQDVQNGIIEALKPKGCADMPKKILCNCTKEQA